MPTTPKSWLAVGFLAIFSSSIAIAAFVAGLNRVGPTQAAVLSTLEPVVTIGLGVAFLNESLHTSTVIGALVIVFSALGLTLAQSRHISVASLTTFIFTAFGVKK